MRGFANGAVLECTAISCIFTACTAVIPPHHVCNPYPPWQCQPQWMGVRIGDTKSLMEMRRGGSVLGV